MNFVRLFFILVLFSPAARAADVEIFDITALPWPSSADGVFAQHICATQHSQIRKHLQDSGHPYSPSLIIHKNQKFCHIVYEPSQPGFRAKADIGNFQTLVMSVDSASFFIGRKRAWGDSYDVWKSLEKIIPSVPKTLIVQNFGLTMPAQHTSLDSEPIAWTQDYIVSGSTPTEAHFVLFPFKLFENQADFGPRFAPMLEELPRKFQFPGARSKIAWEGGDLVVLQRPGSRRTILVYGHTFAKYWAEELEQKELEFILQREFGTDEIINGQYLSNHVDYTVMPVNGNTLLLAKPFVGDKEFFCDVTQAALRDYRTNLKITPPLFKRLQEAACAPATSMTEVSTLFARALKEFEDHRAEWIRNHQLEPFHSLITRVLSIACPKNLKSEECAKDLIGTTPPLLATSRYEPQFAEVIMNSSIDGNSNTSRFENYYALLEGQLLNMDRYLLRYNSFRDKLRSLGFHFIEVPRPYHKSGWAGISYNNALIVDRQIFMPSFGLHRYERQLTTRLKNDFPEFSFTMVPAQNLIHWGGGLHCSVKAIR